MNISHAVQGDEMNVSNQFRTSRSLFKKCKHFRINFARHSLFKKCNHNFAGKLTFLLIFFFMLEMNEHVMKADSKTARCIMIKLTYIFFAMFYFDFSILFKIACLF